MHTHMLFSRSYTWLCALETAHTPYTIYFALIHHCTSSLSSLHIFVHHCTFCASLHTKTSPAPNNIMLSLKSRAVKNCQKTLPCKRYMYGRLNVYTQAYS